MSDPKIPDIPAIGSLPDQLRNLEVFLRKTRELIQTREPVADAVGDPLDKFVSRRELVRSGLTYRTGGFGGIGVGSAGPPGPPGVPGGAYVPDLTPPPTPTGLTVTAGFTQLIIQCDAALYTQGHGHDRTLVYGAKWPSGAPPTFSNAVPLMDFQGTIANYATDMATRWCIWIKWQSVDGVLSTSPAGGVNGVQATTGQDIATLLTLLTGQITESQLYAALGARINLIDGVGAGSVNARILTESTARISGDSANAALVTTLQASINAAGANRLRNSGFEVVSTTPNRANGWAAYNNSPGETSTLSLVAGRLGGTAQRHAWVGSNTSTKGLASNDTIDGTNLGGVVGRWTPNATYVVSWYARSGATISGGMRLEWNVAPATQTPLLNTPVTPGWERWATRITMGASVEANGGLFISIVGAGTGYIELDDVQVQEGSLLTGYAPGDQAELVASVQTEATARANADGTLFAQYTVKLDVNGYVSGYGLASTSTGAAPTSSFIIRADSFAIASPSGPGILPIVPFIVQTTPTTINGVSVPVGVYIDTAYILNGSITNAKIGNAVIDDAKVANLSAAKLTIGDGTVGGNLKSSGYVPGVQGWIVRPNGTAEFEFAHIRGTLQAGQIAASYVTATMIDSRGLSIKDGAGNVILAAGTGIDFNTRFAVGTIGVPANNATADLSLFNSVGTGQTIAGNAVSGSSGGFSNLTASRNAQTAAAYCAWAPAVGAYYVAGLDSSSTVSAVNAAYSIIARADGNVSSREGGATETLLSTYAAGDVLAVEYDGVNVRYLKNGAVLRTISAAANQVLFLVTSINSGSISRIRFGPLTNIAGVTAQAAAAAVTANLAVTQLSDKLSKSGADTMTGPISLAAASAILVGTVNDGLYLGSTGLVGRKASATTFSISAAGDAIFGGSLSFASGTFDGSFTAGALQVAGASLFSPAYASSGSAYDCTSAFADVSLTAPSINPGSTGSVSIVVTCDFRCGSTASGGETDTVNFTVPVFRVMRGATQVASWSPPLGAVPASRAGNSFTFLDTPGGAAVYKVQAQDTLGGAGAGGKSQLLTRTMTVMGVTR